MRKEQIGCRGLWGLRQPQAPRQCPAELLREGDFSLSFSLSPVDQQDGECAAKLLFSVGSNAWWEQLSCFRHLDAWSTVGDFAGRISRCALLEEALTGHRFRFQKTPLEKFSLCFLLATGHESSQLPTQRPMPAAATIPTTMVMESKPSGTLSPK